MASKVFIIYSEATYLDGSTDSTDEATVSGEKAAIAYCNRKNEEYKERRKNNKQLPKIIWLYRAR